MSVPYQAIIIGTGQAGPPLAAPDVSAGMKVAIIERGLFGGTCVNTGCIPTKTMVASAYAAHLASRAADFGSNRQSPVGVDMKASESAQGRDIRAVESQRGKRAPKDENCTVLPGPRPVRIAP